MKNVCEEFQKNLKMLKAYIEIICQIKVYANIKQFTEEKKALNRPLYISSCQKRVRVNSFLNGQFKL